jgi:hypothetical protein
MIRSNSGEDKSGVQKKQRVGRSAMQANDALSLCKLCQEYMDDTSRPMAAVYVDHVECLEYLLRMGVYWHPKTVKTACCRISIGCLVHIYFNYQSKITPKDKELILRHVTEWRRFIHITPSFPYIKDLNDKVIITPILPNDQEITIKADLTPIIQYVKEYILQHVNKWRQINYITPISPYVHECSELVDMTPIVQHINKWRELVDVAFKNKCVPPDVKKMVYTLW